MDPQGQPNQLLDGEKVAERITPHVFAFYNLYSMWAYMAALSAVFIAYNRELLDLVSSPLSMLSNALRPHFGTGILSVTIFKAATDLLNSLFQQIFSLVLYKEYVVFAIWLSLVYLFSMFFSIIRIEWKWIAIMLGAGVSSLAISKILGTPILSSYYIAILLSAIGCFFVDSFRRAHTFYITNYRIITELRFMGLRQNTLSYDKINNLVIEQSAIGSLFNFGTVIPITASGLGMGEDSAAIAVGAAGQVGGNGGPYIGGAVIGGRSVEVPRTRSQYALFGVTDPQRVHNVIAKYMQDYTQAPYLKDMSEKMGKMLEQQERMLGEKRGK